jgi:hypothetical protein
LLQFGNVTKLFEIKAAVKGLAKILTPDVHKVMKVCVVAAVGIVISL